MRTRKAHIVFQYDDAKAVFLDSKSQAEEYRDKMRAESVADNKLEPYTHGWHIRTLECIDFS